MKLWERLRRLSRGYDVVFLSFPKCGRTWHRVLLGSYLALLAKEPLQRSLKLDELVHSLGARRVRYMHGHANFEDGMLPSDRRFARSSDWAGRDVLLLVRDPRDVLVSAYHHARYRSGKESREIGDFIRDPRTGIDKILLAWQRWDRDRGLARRFEVTAYEDMLIDPAPALRQSLSLMAVRIDQALVAQAAEFAAFEKMKQYEATDFFGEGSMRNRGGRPEAAKVRAGGAGGHKAHLSPEDLDYIARRSAEIGDPFRTVWDSRGQAG